MARELQTRSDEALARQSQEGDFAAFEELVSRYEARIYAFVFHSCGHETDAREATQDTFVRAFEAITRYDANRPFAPWLFTIARRRTIDCLRTRVPVVEQATPEETDLETPADCLARREEAEDLWRVARSCLPDGQFKALWLRYAEDMDIAQIAGVLDKTQTHVKVLLFRARHTLAEKLDDPIAPPTPAMKGAAP